MFVVRYVDAGEADFKAFDKRPDAQKRFRAACAQVWEGAFESAAIFEVAAAQTAVEAINAAKSGDKEGVVLIDIEPRPLDIDFDLSDLEDDPDAQRP